MKKITDYAELVKEKHALNSALGPVETDLSDASRDYAIGEEFVYDGGLYRAKTAILQHDALVLNTNYEAADSITGQIASVNQALTNEVVTRGSLGAKNLLPNNAVSVTQAGVSFNVNNDGTILVNGTAQESDYFEFYVGLIPKGIDITKKYIFTATPIVTTQEFSKNAFIGISADDVTYQYFIDYGNGVEIDFSTIPNAKYLRADIRIHTGFTANNELFKPMLRLATDSDPTYQPYSMTNRELTPIAQAVSNRNLLDNPWFTVNQRGKTTYDNTTGDQYTVDRWIRTSTNHDSILVVNADGSISFTGGSVTGFLENRFDKVTFPFEFYKGKTITVSVLYGDGTLKSATITMPTTETTDTQIATELLYDSTIGGVRFYYRHNNGSPLFAQIEAFSGKTVTVKAVKVELGSVSTLHMDTAPNYAEELLKCQRYFWRVGSTEWIQNYLGMACSATDVRVPIKFPVEMREKPSLSVNANSGIGVTPWGAGDVIVASAIDRGTKAKDSIVVTLTVTGATAKSPYFIYIPANSYIDFSADL